MELKTNSEYLKRISVEAEHLVADLKDYVFRNGIDGGVRGEITEAEAKKLTKLISGKLEVIGINGNEEVLDDIIAIYDKAIKSIDAELAKNAKLEKGNLDKFNKGTIDSFNNVKKVLESSKGTTAEPLKSALDQLVEEKENGKFEEEYKEIKIEEVEFEENKINDEIKANTEGLNKFELATRKEREALDDTVGLSQEYFKIKSEIDKIEKALANPDLKDEEKEKLEIQKEEKEDKLVSVFKKFDEKYEKDDTYKQKENESASDYLKRMEKTDGKATDMQVKMYVTIKQGDLRKKIETLKGQTLKIYDEAKKEFKEIDVKDYLDVTKGEELNNLSEKINSDKLLNKQGVKEQRDRLNELKKEREKYEKIDSTLETNNQNLPAKITEGMGFREKFSKRNEYYQNQGDNKFKAFFKSLFNRGRDDADVFASEVKKQKVPNNLRKQFLEELEKGIKSGKGKDKIISDIKAKIFTSMDRENKAKKDKSGDEAR